MNPANTTTFESAKRLRDQGDYEEALELLEQEDLIWNGTTRSAQIARDCFLRMGETSMALGVVNHSLRKSEDDVGLRREARRLLGRLIETDPSWRPELPLAAPPVERIPGRVLHLLKESLPYVESGYTMRSAMTLEAQLRGGFEPTVVTSLGFPRREGVTDAPSREDVRGVVHHRLDLGGDYPEQMPFDLLLDDQARLTSQLASELRPSLIQSGSSFRGFDGALVGLALSRALDVPCIYEIRGFLEQTWTSEIERSEHGEYYMRRRAQEYRCLSEATTVITIAEAMRDEIVERGIPASKVAVVPNAVDVERFTPRGKRPDLLSSYELGGRTVIGYVSNLGWREGLQHLIAATRMLADQGHDVACLIVGNGPEHGRLEEMVSELGLVGRVTLTGHVPNASIEDHYALIDLFVVPRVNDRASRLVTPLKPLEAMAMGIPVVAADLPALREQVAPGERGLVFEPGNSTDLARVLDELLNDVDLRRSLAEAASSWVRKERTLDSNVARYKEILDPLL